MALAPTLHPIRETDDSLRQLYTRCVIRSVHYFTNPKDGRNKASVLLGLSWYQTTEVMCTYSAITTRVTGPNISALGAKPAQVEICSTEAIIRRQELSINFSLKFLEILFKRQSERRGFATVYLNRQTSNLEIDWHIRAQNSSYFPEEVNLLLTVVAGPEITSIPFPFNLEIPPNLNSRRRSRSWIPMWMRLKKTVYRPKDGHQGWRCLIDSDHDSEGITNLEVPIGLQAAIDAHLASLPTSRDT